MIPIKDNHDLVCFSVTKHSWKGKYKRIFSVGTHGITTYNPEKLEITNRWPYCDVVTITSSGKQNASTANEFSLVMRKDKKIDTMKFSSEHKNLILTEAFKYRHLFTEKPKESFRYDAYKHHWSDTRLPVVLEVTPCSLDQLDPVNNVPVASYKYCEIEGIIVVQDYPGGFVIACGGFSRLHLFAASNHVEIKNKILEAASNILGINIKVLPTTITLEDFQTQRFGKYSGDRHQTSVSEFVIHKVNSLRHLEPPRRTLCLSETCILERDPQTYSICTLRPLSDVWALVRDANNPQLFIIEYMNNQVRSYLAADRDALLASLLDGVRSSGNRDVHVRMHSTPKGKRWGPLHLPVDEETESNHLRFLISTSGHSRTEMIERFNANIAYSGLVYSVNQDRLFSENKEKLISQALQSLVQGIDNKDNGNISSIELELQFHALRRLGASKVGFSAFTNINGFREAMGLKVVTALKKGDPGVTHAAIDALCALLHPMHSDYDLRQEQLNKSSLLSSKKFLEGLLDMWTEHVNMGSGALVVAAMLDFLTFSLCVPYSETTDSRHFDQLLELVATRGRSVFRLFEHPSMAIVKGGGLVMRALIEEGSAELGAKMQALALAEAALPRHLLIALYGSSRPQHRHLSRHLVGLWATGHPAAMGLLRRILPSGLLAFLDSTEPVPKSAADDQSLNDRDNLKLAQESTNKNKKGPQWQAIERQMKVAEKYLEHYTQIALQHWSAHTGIVVERKEKQRERPIVLRKRREKIKADANWPLFFYQFNQDHALPNLIWNHKPREELKAFLENELRAFNSDRELSGNSLVAWNHTELELTYRCLQDEIQIGDYYLRLLLEAEDSPDSPIRKSYEFFNDLYHRFLLTSKIEMKCMCLQAMSIVYGRYYEDIGPFSDTKYIVQMLDRSVDRMERDRLVIFIHKLMHHRRNVRELLEWNGVRILIDLMSLAHLHTSRATVPTQTNVIEAAPNSGQSGSGEKEWYYNIEKGQGQTERAGPVTFQELKDLYKSQAINVRTKCWASGMDGWRVLQAIPQLKWTLVARGSPVFNESELATLILNVLIKCCEYFPSRDDDNAVIRPLPKIKRLLSDSYCLSHVVQLLLTFDPVLVEKVATLLCDVMQDNPEISKVYMTGVFYFILMYTGSNLLPIARFLQLTHMNQAFRAEDSATSDIMQRSILGQLLPEAMVCYLHNHGAEKFAQIFLGEYDTPEAIWNSEMRRMLIVKMSAHIGDFTPKLKVHTGARYPYLAIPAIRYPQLDSELFCNIFYLRHLCDTQRFPDWPIPEPVKLLKDVLEAWKKEVEKKPPIMTVDEAFKTLGLSSGKHHDESVVRKAYYKLAQQYHPDKNPQGRDYFEAVNQAYEFLCSRSVWTCDGPNPNNIVLVLRAQSILFRRYSDELEPYKYAGYPQLIKTIKLETSDEQLFSKSAPLLAAACELAQLTVKCSALNAEELRREGGLQVLLEAYSRCVSVLTLSSKNNDVAVQVCDHISQCYAISAKFPHCRDVILEMPNIIVDLCRILQFKHLLMLNCSAVNCVTAFSVDGALQTRLLRCGVLWPLLKAVLQYDYTLDEGGVEKSTEANQQEVANQLAKLSITACAMLGGYLTGERETPKNQLARNAYRSLLTPYLANKLSNDTPEELLKILNSNWRNPYLIWDNSTRGELNEFLKSKKQHVVIGEDDDDEEIISCTEFKYSAHEGQLIIGEVFAQIYNEQPSFVIHNAKGFTLDILDFLGRQSQKSFNEETIKNIIIALQSLTNIIKANAGVEIQCIGHFGLLFGLLSARMFPNIQNAALQVVIASAGCSECVEDIAAGRLMGHLLPLIASGPHQLSALNALSPLLTNTSIVMEASNKGAVIYLLDLFCNCNNDKQSELAADLLAKMMSDKLHGPKIKLVICRYLPSIFADAMRSGGSSAAIRMLSTTQQHPELVWDADSKDRVSAVVARHKDEFYGLQMKDPNAQWNSQGDIAGSISSLAWTPPGEIVVGGVYLRLFIANPQWALRSPKTFLSDLLDCTLNNLQKNNQNDMLELCTKALCGLLCAQPTLADLVAGRGHLARLCRYLGQSPQHAVPILHSISNNQVCVNALSQTECMAGLKQAMKIRRDLVGMTCEALSRIFCSSANTDELVHQALETDMVGQLLLLLEGRLEGVSSSGQAVAQAVSALKAMARSNIHGEKVRQILASCRAWEQYANQRHDLFITDTPTAGYLTAGVPQTAGYLTQGPTSNITLQPPPVD